MKNTITKKTDLPAIPVSIVTQLLGIDLAGQFFNKVKLPSVGGFRLTGRASVEVATGRGGFGGL